MKIDFAGGHHSAVNEPLEAAIDALLKRLLEAWAECAPSQLSTNPELASAACCQSILVCARRLLDRQQPGGDLPPFCVSAEYVTYELSGYAA